MILWSWSLLALNLQLFSLFLVRYCYFLFGKLVSLWSWSATLDIFYMRGLPFTRLKTKPGRLMCYFPLHFWPHVNPLMDPRALGQGFKILFSPQTYSKNFLFSPPTCSSQTVTGGSQVGILSQPESCNLFLGCCFFGQAFGWESNLPGFTTTLHHLLSAEIAEDGRTSSRNASNQDESKMPTWL